MPIKYETYGCRFKCGTKHRRSFKQMQDHEENCWHNPKNKTCISCEYGEIIKDYCDHIINCSKWKPKEGEQCVIYG